MTDVLPIGLVENLLNLGMNSKLLIGEMLQKRESFILTVAVELQIAFMNFRARIGKPQIELAIVVRVALLLDQSLKPQLTDDLGTGTGSFIGDSTYLSDGAAGIACNHMEHVALCLIQQLTAVDMRHPVILSHEIIGCILYLP